MLIYKEKMIYSEDTGETVATAKYDGVGESLVHRYNIHDEMVEALQSIYTEYCNIVPSRRHDTFLLEKVEQALKSAKESEV